MHRSKLKNRYHKNPTEENRTAYKKHRNFCVGLLKEKKKYYNNLDMKIFDDNKKFWQKIKPLFSDKSNLKRSITLIENCSVISEKKEVAETLNNYFIEAVADLEVERFASNVNGIIPKNCEVNLQHNRDQSEGKGGTLSTNNERLEEIDNTHITDVNIDDIIYKYRSHPSIIIIKENVELDSKFEFCNVTVDEIYKEINALDTKKASVENDIPVKS